jgi:hypothetical protein
MLNNTPLKILRVNGSFAAEKGGNGRGGCFFLGFGQDQTPKKTKQTPKRLLSPPKAALLVLKFLTNHCLKCYLKKVDIKLKGSWVRYCKYVPHFN